VRQVQETGRWPLLALRGAGVQRHPETWRLRPEAHPYYEVCYVRSGLGTITVGGVAHTASRGALFLIGPGVVHSGHANPYGSVEVAHVHVAWPRPLLDGYRQWVPAQAVVRLEPHLEAELHGILERILDEARRTRPGWPLALSAALLELFAFLVRMGHRLQEGASREASGGDPVRRAGEYIHAHLGERLSVAQVAGAIGYHPNYLSRAFRRETGVRLVEYIMRARVEHAARLLAAEDGRLTMRSVAARSGFAGTHYFARSFRQLKGCSPGEYRRSVARASGRGGHPSAGE
jgi:AraC-like DNA-binding protein